MKKIIVLDAHQKQGLGIARSLCDLGYTVFTLSSKVRWSLKLSKHNFHILNETCIDNNDISKFIHILKVYNIDAIIPVGISSHRFCVSHAKEITSFSKALLPNEETFLTLTDKIKTAKLCKKFKIPYPRMYLKTELDKNITSYFPLVVKAPIECGHNIVEYAFSHDELDRKYSNVKNRMEKLGFFIEPIIQQKITGAGIGFFGLFVDGRCIASYQHRRIREWPPSGGMSTCSEIWFDPNIKTWSEGLMKALKYSGPAMVEYKLDQEGKPHLLEVNPKYWGSHDLALFLGLNFPDLTIKTLFKEKIETPEINISGQRYSWFFHGDFLHGFKNIKNIPRVFLDALNPNVGGNIPVFTDIGFTIGIFIDLLFALSERTVKIFR